MAGQQQQQNTDNSLAMLWGLGLGFAFLVIFWFFYSTRIIQIILKIRLWQAHILAFFIPHTKHLANDLRSLDASTLQFEDLVTISSAIGTYLRIPIGILLSIFAYVIYINRPGLRFKNQYNMQSLVAQEQTNWFQIAPVVNLNLVDTRIDKMPWAMALTPVQFAKQYHLLQVNKIPPPVSAVAAVINQQSTQLKLNREVAHHVFTMQLGSMWQSIETLNMPTKAMFVICAARAVHDRAVADQLVAHIAHSAKAIQSFSADAKHEHTLDFSGVEPLVQKYQKHPLIVHTINKHAYVLSVMASMLLLARENGVFASADFLWLKPCDRALWFMLNCVGRRTAYVEVAGPFAHWIVECTLKRALKMPRIEAAVDGLEEALKEVNLEDPDILGET